MREGLEVEQRGHKIELPEQKQGKHHHNGHQVAVDHGGMKHDGDWRASA